jgi:hypothetical protein
MVLAVSVIVGLLMVVVFRYTSNQKAIRRAKDVLKAHLLAVRLFQDQLPVVLQSYGNILRGTGTYLRLAFTPFLIVIIPMTFLMIQMDHYLGRMPLQTAQPFLIEARVSNVESLDQIQIHMPDAFVSTAPTVHITKEKLAVWRLNTTRHGEFDLGFEAGGQTVLKHVVVSPVLARLSPARLQGKFWERMLSSTEPALPDSSVIESISVNYPERNIDLLGIQWNWIVLFFVVSLVAGFIFKSVFGIQI